LLRLAQLQAKQRGHQLQFEHMDGNRLMADSMPKRAVGRKSMSGGNSDETGVPGTRDVDLTTNCQARTLS
jgi:hypothetical protein